MKKLITLFIIIVYVPVLVSAKKYHITKAEIVATIHKNGVVHFEESRTYDFNGSFKWVSFEMPKRGFDRLQNVQVWEGDKLYAQNDTEVPETFEIREKSNRYIIKWFIKASDTQKTYTVTYDLIGAIVSDDNWSEFYWTYLSKNWDKQNEFVSIKLQFEENTDIRFWTFSNRTTSETIDQLMNGWTYSATTTSKRHEVKIQTQFPTDYLNLPSSITGVVDPIQQEKVYQDHLLDLERKAARSEVWAAWGWKFYVPMLVIPFFFFFRFYTRNKPEHGHIDAADSALPDSVHPAIVTYLMNFRTVSIGALKATLMKFVFDGVIRLEYEGREKKMLENRPLIKIHFTDVQELDLKHEFERDFYRFLKERSEKYEYLDDIFKKNGHKVQSWLMKWTKLVKKAAKQESWYVEESKTDMYWNIAVQLLFMILGIAFVVAVGPLGAFIIGVPGVLLALSGVIYHRNEDGELLYQKMDTAKKAIKNLRKNKQDVSGSSNWPLFIWALALGNTKADVKWLIKQWPADSIPNISFATALNSVDMVFVLDDIIMLTHGNYMGTVGAGGTAGAAAGAAGGGAGGGAG